MNLLAVFFCGLVNRLFRYHEKSTIIFFLFFASAFALMLHFAASVNFIVMGLAFCGLSASIFAVNNMLTTFIPLHFMKAGRVSTAAGLLDCAVYIGAALSGPLAGLSADRLGWTGITAGWIAAAILALIAAFISRDYKEKPLSW
jgi:sugar phosphate permease